MEILFDDPETGARALFVPRSEWGSRASTESFIAGRRRRPASSKTEVQIHNTAGVDSDVGEDDEANPTPNLWDYDDAVHYMRRLEFVRPDLGPLPYSENVALAEDGQTVWFFEGRGLRVSGAHTKGHNIPGIGWGFLGNFQRYDDGHDLIVQLGLPMLARRLHSLRYDQGFVHLGDVRNPRGWEVWGHRDTSSKACPGTYIYRHLGEVHFVAAGDPAPPISIPPGGGIYEMTLNARTGPRSLAMADLQTGLVRNHGYELVDDAGEPFPPYTPEHAPGADGWPGDVTAGAVIDFKGKRGLPATDSIDGITAALILEPRGSSGPPIPIAVKSELVYPA